MNTKSDGQMHKRSKSLTPLHGLIGQSDAETAYNAILYLKEINQAHTPKGQEILRQCLTQVRGTRWETLLNCDSGRLEEKLNAIYKEAKQQNLSALVEKELEKLKGTKWEHLLTPTARLKTAKEQESMVRYTPSSLNRKAPRYCAFKGHFLMSPGSKNA